MSTPPQANVRVRASTLKDYDAIVAGIGDEMNMVSAAEYQHRWSTNPFQPADQKGNTGWLMETDAGSVVGWFGNIYSGYEMDGRLLLAAATHAVVVKEAFRNRSLGLISQFFRQRNVDLLLVTTTNEKAAEVWTAMKMVRVPHPTYDRVLYWIANPRRFVAAGLRRKRVPAAGAIGFVAGTMLPKQLHGTSRVKLIGEFDERFDQFWSTMRQRRGKLHAVRSREALAWHYHDAGVTCRRAILVIEDQSSLAGYAILTRRDAPEIGLRRYQIADLQVLRDDPQLVRDLLVGGMRATREHDVDVLESTGFEPFKRGLLESMNPRARQSPSFPYLYKAQSPELAASLQSPAAWDPCPYDGDAAF